MSRRSHDQAKRRRQSGSPALPLFAAAGAVASGSNFGASSYILNVALPAASDGDLRIVSTRASDFDVSEVNPTVTPPAGWSVLAAAVVTTGGLARREWWYRFKQAGDPDIAAFVIGGDPSSSYNSNGRGSRWVNVGSVGNSASSSTAATANVTATVGCLAVQLPIPGSAAVTFDPSVTAAFNDGGHCGGSFATSAGSIACPPLAVGSLLAFVMLNP